MQISTKLHKELIMKTFKVYFRGTNNFEIIKAKSYKAATMLMANKHGLASTKYLRAELLQGV